MATFGEFFGEIRQLFVPSSGHTVRDGCCLGVCVLNFVETCEWKRERECDRDFVRDYQQSLFKCLRQWLAVCDGESV